MVVEETWPSFGDSSPELGKFCPGVLRLWLVTYRSYLEKFVLFFLKFNLFYYFWLVWVLVAARELFSSWGKQGPLSHAGCSSHCLGLSLFFIYFLPWLLCGAEALGAPAWVVAARELSSCGAGASLLQGMRNLPGPGANPCPLHWQADSCPLHLQGSPGFILDSVPRQAPYGPWGRPLLLTLFFSWFGFVSWDYWRWYWQRTGRGEQVWDFSSSLTEQKQWASSGKVESTREV